MTAFSQFDRVVSSMMSKYGTTALLQIAVSNVYNPDTSENVVTYEDYPVKAMFFDYLNKYEGTGNERNTLIQSGDKQVYVQPPQKSGNEPLPRFNPGSATIQIAGTQYRVITVKQLNTNMTNDGCVLYELYVRE